MRIADLYAQPGPTFSIEFFPPKTPRDEQVLFEETVPALVRLAPDFASVTYGAGGSTRDATLRIAGRLKSQFGLETMCHFTCVGSTRQTLAEVMDQTAAAGIENLLCLRGDPPKGQTEFVPTEGGFAYAVDLVRFVAERGGFGIGVAGYPEGHIQCPDKRLDWQRTVDKIAAGGQFIITQLFYDFDDFAAFHDYLRNAGVTVPIIPGLLPFHGTAQIKRFTSLSGSRLPPALLDRLEQHASDDEYIRKLGVEVCSDLARRLLDYGVAGLHIYGLNRVASVSEIMENLASVRAA